MRTLQPLIDRAAFHNEDSRQRAIEKYEDRVNPIMLGVQFGFFLDCFVFRVPTSFQGRIYSMVSEIILPLLKQGFLLRGGIAAGKLVHRDNILFGPAMIRAYSIERREAKFARVLVDPSALTAVERQEDDALIQDHLGNWVVDPFPWVATTNESRMQDMLHQLFDPTAPIRVIDGKVQEYEGVPRLRDIWRFQAQVCALSLQKYGPPAGDWVKALRALAA